MISSLLSDFQMLLEVCRIKVVMIVVSDGEVEINLFYTPPVSTPPTTPYPEKGGRMAIEFRCCVF